MESLYLQQEDTVEYIQKAHSNYKKTPKDRLTESYIETRIENLEKSWTKFTETHTRIVGAVKKSERVHLPYFAQNVFFDCEDMYTEYTVKLKEDLKKLRVTSVEVIANSEQPAASTSATMSEVKLPQIMLPSFSGGYEDWQTFYDMYTNTIHKSKTLSPVQKFTYLKSCISGEPENLIRNLATTEQNYEEAWMQLTKRYNNKKYISKEIMKRLFNQKTLNTESASSIRQLYDTTNACLKSVRNLDIDTSSWDIFLTFLIASKLDPESHKQWETQVSTTPTDDLSTWDELSNFLEARFRTLEAVEGNKPVTRPFHSNSSTRPIIKQKLLHSAINTDKRTNTCIMCSGPHILYQCKQFGSHSPIQRVEFIKSKRLCFNCLASTHSVKNCHQSTCCRRCGRRHHTLLHYEREQLQDSYNSESINSARNSEQTTSARDQSSTSEKKVVAHFTAENYVSNVLLATAIVKTKSKNGYTQFIRVLIDQGSEASFVTEEMVQLLGLKRVHVNGLVTGVGDKETRTKYMVSFNIESIHSPDFAIQVKAYVLSTLTSILPSRETVIEWPDIEKTPLADPLYGSPAKIDVVLGVDIYSEIMCEGLLKHPLRKGLIAQNTYLGWVLSGKIENNTSSSRRIVCMHSRSKEDEFLKQFWEMEREPDSRNIIRKLTREESHCEELYEATTRRDTDGRYVVRLPFKTNNPLCLGGKSKEIAIKRFKLLERKLVKNPTLYEEYKKAINSYLEENHMMLITDTTEIDNHDAIYLPHHAVIRAEKETTKIRIVFDASCKGVNNISLNYTLMVGPKLQQDLRHILMRWRRHPICIIADLVKMYLQIRVESCDTNFQRLVWRPDPELPIQHYKLLRLTFGTSCAPYLAVKSLQQLAKDEKANYPTAAKITLEDYYMDDLLTGSETVEEAVEIFVQMNKLMNAGGFNLQKWSSNSNELLDFIAEDNQRLSPSLTFKVNGIIKVLGLCWNKTSDNFEYTLDLPNISETTTKRKVLSDIARLYDPMGWIAPVIITAKIFIQRLWKSNLSWDENLPTELLREWVNFREDLTDIAEIRIPRWLQTKRNDEIELHVFADASSSAYAAVLYLKTRNVNGEIKTHLVTAKTKVAPVQKDVSIPRLELCGGLLAAKLLYEVSQIMNVPKEKLFAWTDSTILLAWLQGEPSRWTTFVSNRVSEILTMLDKNQWHHVCTQENPADCASRGIRVTKLVNHELWWHGPCWLNQTQRYNEQEIFETVEEQKPIKSLSSMIKPREEFFWTKFSTLQNLLGILAYCRKWLNFKAPRDKRTTYIDKKTRMEEALKFCIKETQNLHFCEEIRQLKSQKAVLKRSLLHTLHPFLDVNEILRVGGRIDQSLESFDRKHPIILPNDCHLTRLVVLNSHTKTLHGGPQLMLNFLRSRFWIVRGRELVRRHYRQCVVCCRYLRTTNTQLMGQLPQVRLKPSKPFKSSGVDFTGHINIRFSPGRGAKSYKGYICVFICMVTKAIHLEAVSDLSSQGFIAAFRRFVSRRGHCQDLYSDNGTNFVGASKELMEMFNKAVSSMPHEISHLLANEGTRWHFIPPHAPHFGGLWEAGVRSTKAHLKRVIGDSTLTYEELSTLLTQVEACLNSRPLSYLSDSPDDPLPLTPAHFLVSEPLITIPDEDSAVQPSSLTNRWRLIQKMVTDYWRQWSKEYLLSLNQRYKWTTQQREPEIDDVIVVRDDNIPPAKWLLGRVVTKHPGKDGLTRVVTLKTKTGTLKRPCNRLCLLLKTDDPS